MTRDEIYDHLAQVYLGKRKKAEKKKKLQFNAWLLINILITGIIFSSAFYGLTAFLKHRSSFFESKIVYSLHHGRIFLEYNFKKDLSPVKTFALTVPEIDANQYKSLQFSLRAKEEERKKILSSVITLYAIHNEIALLTQHRDRDERAAFYPEFFEDKNVIDYPDSLIQGIMQGTAGADLNERRWKKRS